MIPSPLLGQTKGVGSRDIPQGQALGSGRSAEMDKAWRHGEGTKRPRPPPLDTRLGPMGASTESTAEATPGGQVHVRGWGPRAWPECISPHPALPPATKLGP